MNITNITNLSNNDVNSEKPLTKEEFNQRIERGIIKSGDTALVYNEWGYPVKTKYIVIPPPTCKNYEEKIKKKKGNFDK